MRNTVDKQSKGLAGKSRKLFWCGVDEFSPINPYYSKEIEQCVSDGRGRLNFKPNNNDTTI